MFIELRINVPTLTCLNWWFSSEAMDPDQYDLEVMDPRRGGSEYS